MLAIPQHQGWQATGIPGRQTLNDKHQNLSELWKSSAVHQTCSTINSPQPHKLICMPTQQLWQISSLSLMYGIYQSPETMNLHVDVLSPGCRTGQSRQEGQFLPTQQLPPLHDIIVVQGNSNGRCRLAPGASQFLRQWVPLPSIDHHARWMGVYNYKLYIGTLRAVTKKKNSSFSAGLLRPTTSHWDGITIYMLMRAAIDTQSLVLRVRF